MSKKEKDEKEPAGPKDTLDFVSEMSERAVEIYEATLALLEQGIKAGKNNPMLGYMSLLVYADLLHGGAYTSDIKNQPYYNQNEFREFIDSLTLPGGATEAQKEILFNSRLGHVFPKLISDQTAFVLKDYADRIFAVDFAGALVGIGALASTSLTTLVESGTARGKSTQAAALKAQSQL